MALKPAEDHSLSRIFHSQLLTVSLSITPVMSERSIQGVGTYWGTDGSLYTGNWVQGIKHGLGRRCYANGDSYEGFWSRGAAEGPGKYTWANGNEYFGEWHKGSMHGWGTFSWAGGDSFEGQWEGGYEHGEGTFTWADGSRYEGTWSLGLKDGKGLYYPPGVWKKTQDSGPTPDDLAGVSRGSSKERDGGVRMERVTEGEEGVSEEADACPTPSGSWRASEDAGRLVEREGAEAGLGAAGDAAVEASSSGRSLAGDSSKPLAGSEGLASLPAVPPARMLPSVHADDISTTSSASPMSAAGTGVTSEAAAGGMVVPRSSSAASSSSSLHLFGRWRGVDELHRGSGGYHDSDDEDGKVPGGMACSPLIGRRLLPRRDSTSKKEVMRSNSEKHSSRHHHQEHQQLSRLRVESPLEGNSSSGVSATTAPSLGAAAAVSAGSAAMQSAGSGNGQEQRGAPLSLYISDSLVSPRSGGSSQGVSPREPLNERGREEGATATGERRNVPKEGGSMQGKMMVQHEKDRPQAQRRLQRQGVAAGQQEQEGGERAGQGERDTSHTNGLVFPREASEDGKSDILSPTTAGDVRRPPLPGQRHILESRSDVTATAATRVVAASHAGVDRRLLMKSESEVMWNGGGRGAAASAVAEAALAVGPSGETSGGKKIVLQRQITEGRRRLEQNLKEMAEQQERLWSGPLQALRSVSSKKRGAGGRVSLSK